MDIPPALLNAVCERNAVLVLGSGASLEARNAAGHHPATAQALRDAISDRFLGGKFKDYGLAQVA
jgi:hypothetical protein